MGSLNPMVATTPPGDYTGWDTHATGYPILTRLDTAYRYGWYHAVDGDTSPAGYSMESMWWTIQYYLEDSL